MERYCTKTTGGEGMIRRWVQIEDGILRELYPRADEEEICAALPGRTFKAIQKRAMNLKIRRWHPTSRSNRRAVHPVIVGLRSAREAQELNRDDLAAKAGYHVISLLRWELGKAQPPLACLVDWAAALGFDIVLRARKAESDVIPFPEKRQLMARR